MSFTSIVLPKYDPKTNPLFSHRFIGIHIPVRYCLFYFSILFFCPISFFLNNSYLTLIGLFGLHHMFVFLFLSFFIYVHPLFVIWQIGNCLPGCACLCVRVCAGQMPFPPEYLAPPAERLKKEKKPKTPKNKKETTGKVREEKERLDTWRFMKDPVSSGIFTKKLVVCVSEHSACLSLSLLLCILSF